MHMVHQAVDMFLKVIMYHKVKLLCLVVQQEIQLDHTYILKLELIHHLLIQHHTYHNVKCIFNKVSGGSMSPKIYFRGKLN